MAQAPHVEQQPAAHPSRFRHRSCCLRRIRGLRQVHRYPREISPLSPPPRPRTGRMCLAEQASASAAAIAAPVATALPAYQNPSPPTQDCTPVTRVGASAEPIPVENGAGNREGMNSHTGPAGADAADLDQHRAAAGARTTGGSAPLAGGSKRQRMEIAAAVGEKPGQISSACQTDGVGSKRALKRKRAKLSSRLVMAGTGQVQILPRRYPGLRFDCNISVLFFAPAYIWDVIDHAIFKNLIEFPLDLTTAFTRQN